MEANNYKKIQSAYQKIIDSETSFKELAMATILEEVKQNNNRIVLKKPFILSEFSYYYALHSNGNLSGYYKDPKYYSGDKIPCAVPIERLNSVELKKLAEIILTKD